MGLTAYSKTIIGVAVTDADFFTVQGHYWECPQCHKHFPDDNRFCPQDGIALYRVAITEPTPTFAAYAAAAGVPPDDLLRELREVWKPGPIGLFQNHPLQCSEDRPVEVTSYALGKLLCSVSSDRAVHGGPVRLDQLPVDDVRKVADALGMRDRPLQLFTCLYLSI